MHAEEVIREYYESLRRGEPLYPYFLEDETTVKFGVSEALYGYEAVVDGLLEQTKTTDDWTVESTNLTVDEREGYAVFADEIRLEWTDLEAETRHEFETRWSGTLERHGEEWRFVSMHVSTPHDL
ncbi:AtzH-like domain-containing protein [Natrialbaceae archaeon A-gly3]